MSFRLHSPLAPLVARDVRKTYGDRTVLAGVDVVANPGRPLGLVGENGSGKSTLLRILSGVEPADGGTYDVPADLGYLPQEPAFPVGASVADVLDRALAPLHQAVHRLELLAGRLDDPAVQDEYADLLDWVTAHDAWDAGPRALAAAARLGLREVDRERQAASLSGGERMRLALAALITRRPQCLLLDEPTNHLDDDATAFVEAFIAGLPGVVVVASHDRVFLDNVCAVVQDLDPSRIGLDGSAGATYSGGYTDYLRVKRQERRRWEEAYDAHRLELDRLRGAARTTARAVAPHHRPPRDGDKFIPHVQGQKVARAVSRRVRDTERRIEVLERERVLKPPRTLAFTAALTGGRGAAVAARDLTVTGRLGPVRLDVAPGDRLLVTGANGSGKSTLLRVLAGELAAEGTLRVSARRVGHLPQEVRFARAGRRVADVYAAATAGLEAPRLPELGLLHPRELARPVGALSIGQQRRLALAVLVARRPDLLLLDEPTNHISLALAEELEEALRRSAGTVVVASHDRWLRRRWEGAELRL